MVSGEAICIFTVERYTYSFAIYCCSVVSLVHILSDYFPRSFACNNSRNKSPLEIVFIIISTVTITF